MTTLHYSCLRNHLWDNQLFADSRPEDVSRAKVVQILLVAGAYKATRDLQDNIPIQVLARVHLPDWSEVPEDSDLLWRGNDLIECLERLTGDVRDVLRWDSHGTTILHYAAYLWPSAVNEYLMDYLLSFSVPVTLIDRKGFTPLHYAVIRPFEDSGEIMDLLSRSGADIHVRGTQDMDALAVAKRHAKLRALDQLLTLKKAQDAARKKDFQEMLYQA
jgi:ankyrin repeat protein